MSEIRVREGSAGLVSPTTSEERTWAALAHASTLLTLLFGLPTAGLSGVLLVFVPLMIYLAYRDKSRFVASHAAQAFGLQVVGTVGYFVALLAGILVIGVAWLVTLILSFILIGFILIPVATLITIIVPFIWIALPFVLGGFAVVATIETASGRDYHYPYVGRWVDDWLERQEAASTPAV